MPDPTPTVTVVIPAWNRADSIGRTIESVVNQDFDDLELIVVDDGSTDTTPGVVEAVSDQRLRLCRSEHRGVSAARNAGARLARGTVLLFLDCEDLARPGWVEEMSTPILAGQCDLTLSGWQMRDSHGRESAWIPDSRRMNADDISPYFLAGSWAISKDLFLAVGGFDETIAYGECTELALRLLLSEHRPCIGSIARPLHIHHRRVGLPPGVQAAGARSVLVRYRDRRRSIPRTWAAYHTLVGVDDSRNMCHSQATRHFLAAFISDPCGGRRTSRLLVSLIPKLAQRVWGRERSDLTRTATS